MTFSSTSGAAFAAAADALPVAVADVMAGEDAAAAIILLAAAAEAVGAEGGSEGDGATSAGAGVAAAVAAPRRSDAGSSGVERKSDGGSK